jgi:hypothetical protein
MVEGVVAFVEDGDEACIADTVVLFGEGRGLPGRVRG